MISLQQYLEKGQTVLSNLLLESYHHIGMTDQEFLLWLQLFKAAEKGDRFPDLEVIGEITGYSQKEIYRLLNQLVQKNLLSIQSEKDDKGLLNDAYDFSAVFEKLSLLTEQQKRHSNQQEKEKEEQNLYQMFETEFGRALSPIEFQRIGQWLEEDHYRPELIRLALKEAVLNQAYSLNYIDRILLSWERKNIKTKEQVAQEQKKRKRQMLQKETTRTEKKLPKVSLHNWLEDQE
ncbi:MAG TPA: DnaD domain protein [Candidatus Tetragenococcus pullicola]|nr:DnaD domain protein [Candidatus Tetragenococcus pullicola]